jgi:hypothetical protein
MPVELEPGTGGSVPVELMADSQGKENRPARKEAGD